MKELKIEKTNEVYYYGVSDIGLPVYFWVNERASNFYMTLNVKFGSIDTEFRVGNNKKFLSVPNGTAHFLEHIKFNMAKGVSAFDKFVTLGTNPNAFTTFDYTCYMVYSSTKFQDNLKLLLDFVLNLYVTDDLINKERGIISEEVKMGEDNANSKFFYETNRAIYKNDKRKYEIAGSVADVSKISKKDIELVFNSFYRPENMFLVITGNFNPYEAMAIVNETTKDMKFPQDKITKKKVKEDERVVLKEKVIKDKMVEIPKVNIAYKMKRTLFKDYKDEELKAYLLAILAYNFGAISDFKETLLKNELVNYLSYSVDVNADLVVITLRSVSKYPQEIIKKLQKKMEELEITDNILKTLVKASWADAIWAFDDIEMINDNIQSEILAYGDVLTRKYSIYKKLNITDAAKILKSIDLKNSAIVVLEKEA